MPLSIKELQNKFYVEQEVEEVLERDEASIPPMSDYAHILLCDAYACVERKLQEGFILYNLIDYGRVRTVTSAGSIVCYKQVLQFFRFVPRGAASWPGINAPTPIA